MVSIPTLPRAPGRRLAALAGVGLLALALGGCGRRGPLEAPPDGTLPPTVRPVTPVPSSVRRTSAPTTTAPAPTTLATQSGGVVTNGPEDEDDEQPAITVSPQPTPGRRTRSYVVPKEPFLLDPLL